MTPLDQTVFGNGENGNDVGNCWQACIASICDLPLDTVPHFAKEFPKDWWVRTRQFVINSTGVDFGCFNPDFPLTDQGYYVIGCGIGPRGVMHSVILDGVTGELAHDPHPSHLGLQGPVIEVFGFIKLEE